MKIWGALVVLLYASLAISGWEPFAPEERGAVPAQNRGSGVFMWFGGYRGGK